MDDEQRCRLEDVCARLRGVFRARYALRDHGRLVEAESAPGDPERIEAVREQFGLPELYVEYLRHHGSVAFGADFDLRWQGVSLSLSNEHGIEDLQFSYASDGWPEHWVTIGAEYEGCYFIDVTSGAIGYLDHGVGLRYQEAGADLVEFFEQVIEASDPGAECELHEAIAAHDLERAQRLLEAGDVPDEFTLTPLVAAVLYGVSSLVEVLLERGVDLDEVSEGVGCSALGIAIGTGQRRFIVRLLEAGADPDAVDDQGRTALAWAKARGDEQLAALAIDKGASPVVEPRSTSGRAPGAGTGAGVPSEPEASGQVSRGRWDWFWDLPVELMAVIVGFALAVIILVVILLAHALGLL